ncbi:PREDICTED: myb-like protein X [Trachymyrmex cornetzi]|uniref:myb-like protein X n=1 Tax=Trachymyrmex cornetzi TaxID=471704 RepID=UPI00084EE8E4|nr:PREDICTED: myb-like protein X [Trachymyrmex cornetzi]
MLQNKLGQTILKYTDYFLSFIEKCMEWSLPEQNIEDEKESGTTELVRPLPWLLFLPCLVIIRLIRVIINIGAFMFNSPKITPSEMIKFVQTRRRYLHDAMKKDKKERYELEVTTSEEKSEEKPEEKPEEKSEEEPEEKSVVESVDSTTTSKHSMSESEEEKQEKEENEKRKETLTEKINRLALENSEDDEDFDPDEYALSDMDSIDDDDENSNDDVSQDEIRDIIKDKKEFMKNMRITEQFLKAERAFTLASNQKLVESACEKRSSAKESRDKVEEHFAILQRIDSLECCTSDRSSQEGDPTFCSPVSSDSDSDTLNEPSMSIAKQCVSRKILKTKEFINGEARFSASMISDSKSRQTNNDAVVEKHSTNMSKSHKGKRTSRRKKN